jgi:hypothetical protein
MTEEQKAINKIQMFMWSKELKLRKIPAYKKGLYYDKNVKHIIKQLYSPETIWQKIGHNILMFPNTGLCDTVCPFCIEKQLRMSNCENCDYATIKGICMEELSSYEKIVHSVYTKGINSSLSPKFYKRIYYKIDKMWIQN